MQHAYQRKEPAGCSATAILKLVALIFMFMDHSGKMVFGNMTEMRALGRLAFPIYCWCLAVGAHYTSSMPKYLLRMAVLFAASQPLYMIALNHGWNDPNIFLTLMVGLIGLWGMRERKWGSQVWAPILALVLAQVLNCNYGWKGVLLILLLYMVRDTRSGIAAVMIAFCLYWGSGSSTVKTLFGLQLDKLLELPGGRMLEPMLKLQALSILALPLILMPTGKHLSALKLPKWLGYGLYPAHLIVLIVMECLMLDGGAMAVYHRMMGLVVNPVLRLFGLG